MKKILKYFILRTYRNHNKTYNTNYSEEVVEGFGTFLIKDLHVSCFIDGKSLNCSIEESPHYKLIKGIEEGQSSLINDYIQYQININENFNHSAKMEQIKSIIKAYKQGAMFVILIRFELKWNLRGKLIIFDGNHRAAIHKYFGDDKIFASYK